MAPTQLKSLYVVDRTRIHVHYHGLEFSNSLFSWMLLWVIPNVCLSQDLLWVLVIFFQIIYPFGFSFRFLPFPYFASPCLNIFKSPFFRQYLLIYLCNLHCQAVQLFCWGLFIPVYHYVFFLSLSDWLVVITLPVLLA